MPFLMRFFKEIRIIGDFCNFFRGIQKFAAFALADSSFQSVHTLNRIPPPPSRFQYLAHREPQTLIFRGFSRASEFRLVSGGEGAFSVLRFS